MNLVFATALVWCTLFSTLPANTFASTSPTSKSKPANRFDESAFEGSLHTQHFSIFYLQGQAGWAKTIEEHAEEYYQKVLSDLGSQSPQHVWVLVVANLNDMRRFSPSGTQVPAWAAGLAFPSYQMILIRTKNGPQPIDQISKIFLHEWAHIAFDHAIDFGLVPRWFREGFAIYQSGEWSVQRVRALMTGVLSGRLLSLDQLDSQFPSRSLDAELAYAQSIDFLSSLLGEYGIDQFHKLIVLLSQGWPFPAALEEAYNSGLGSLEERWHQDLKSRFAWITVLSGSALLWFLASLVFLLAFWKRRQSRHKEFQRMDEEEHDEETIKWS